MVWLDFVAWLDSLGKRNRRIAEMLAADMPGKEVAEQFGISRGRTSRLRRELREDRRRFQSDAAA